ncbi:MAG: FG-GAP-like repeat-containing protein, partial [Phycisphaerales bacterium]
MVLLPAIVALLAVAVPVSAQTVIHVNAAAAPGGDGNSWGTAFRSLQAAIEGARLIPVDGRDVQIWVAQGRYLPEEESTPGLTRSRVFRPPGGTTILGGFGGSETSSLERNPKVFTTIISGDLDDNDTSPFVNDHQNAYHLIYADAQAANSRIVLDGLQLQAGNSIDAPGSVSGAIWVAGGQVDLIDLVVVANRSSTAVLYSHSPDTTPIAVTVERCVITGNTSGVYAAVLHANEGDWTFRNCAFLHNTVNSNYSNPNFGFVAEIRDSPARFHHCTFAFCRAFGWPANMPMIGHFGSARAEFRGCIVWNNRNDAGTAPVSAVPGSLFENNLWGGVGFFEANDPHFLNLSGLDGLAGTADDRVDLTADSPAIDAGLPANLPSSSILDVRGLVRTVDGNGDTFAQTDIGASEFLSYLPIFPGRVFVRSDAPVGGNGATWSTAFRTLQEALAFTATNAIGQIWVATGTYKPSTPLPQDGSRSASFQLRNGLAIYGGFAGTETQLSQRNVAANPTILSGDLNGDDNGDLNRADNSFAVVSGTGLTGGAVLDGFTVTGGSGATDGAGIMLSASSGVALRNLRIMLNESAGSGAGLHATGGDTLVDSCVIEANTAQEFGGGIFSGGGGLVRIKDSSLHNNRAFNGGAIAKRGSGGELTVLRTTLLRNRADLASNGSGGAIYADGPGGLISLVSSSVLGNFATGGFAGLSLSEVSADVLNSTVVGNSTPGEVGALLSFSGSLRVINSAFVSNTAADGTTAGIKFGATGSPTATAQFGNTLLRNSRLAGAESQAAEIHRLDAIPLTITQTSITGWDGTLGGTGNNGLDPLFRRLPSPGPDTVWGTPDDDYGDLRLTNASPAIDSGDSTAIPLDTNDIDSDGNTTESLPLDLDGAARFFDAPAVANTGVGTPPVDRGPFEYVPPDTSLPGERCWVSAPGGSFASPSNWFPGIPNTLDTALFDIAGSYPVNFLAGPAVINARAIVSRGHPVLDLSSATYSLSSALSPALIVGSNRPEPAALTVTGGTLQPFAGIIGADSGSEGTLNVTGPTARLNITQGALNIGFFGRGHLNVTGGARVVTRNASVGDQPGSQGSSVTVSGPGSRWTVPLLLTINNGSVTVADGAVLQNTFGILLFQNGTLGGNGTIIGPVINFGSVEPGNSPGTLTINGSYLQVGEIAELGSSSGKLTMQIDGLNPGQFDRLIVTGQTQLGGGLIVESPVGGFPAPPPEGLSLPLIDALGGIGISDTTGMPADHFDVAFFPRVPGPGGGPSDQFLRLERPEGGGAQFFNLTTGTLGAPLNVNDPSNTSATSTPSSVTAGDLDGDGLSDLVLTTPSNDSAVILMNRGSMGGEWQGFEGAVQFAVGTNPQGATIFDIDVDGIPDLSIVNQGSNSVTLFRNTTIPGSHAVALSGQGSLSTGLGPTGIIAGGFDGSGTRPVIVTTDEAAGVISILIRTGSPGFNFTPRTSKPSPVATPPRAPRELDIDGDGAHPDLALLSVGGSAVVILQNISMGTGIVAFADPVVLPVGDSPSQLEVAMLRDGRP